MSAETVTKTVLPALKSDFDHLSPETNPNTAPRFNVYGGRINPGSLALVQTTDGPVFSD